MAVVAIIASFLVTWIADRYNRSKLILLICVFSLIIAAFFLRISTSHFFVLFWVFCYSFFSAPTSPLVDKIVMDSLRNNPAKYGHLRLGGSLGYGIGSLGIGFILMWNSFFSIFYCFMIVMFITAFIVLVMIQDRKTMEPVETKKTKLHFFDYRELLNNKQFFFIYGTIIIWGITEAAFTHFLALHVQSLGKETKVLGMLLAAAMTGEIFGFFITPILLKKFNPHIIILLSFIMQFIRCLSIYTNIPLGFLLFGQFLGGNSFSLIWTSMTILINLVFPQRMANFTQGLRGISYSGLGYIIGLPICGWLYQYCFKGSLFIFMACISIIYIIIFCTTAVIKHSFKIYKN